MEGLTYISHLKEKPEDPTRVAMKITAIIPRDRLLLAELRLKEHLRKEEYEQAAELEDDIFVSKEHHGIIGYKNLPHFLRYRPDISWANTQDSKETNVSHVFLKM